MYVCLSVSVAGARPDSVYPDVRPGSGAHSNHGLMWHVKEVATTRQHQQRQVVTAEPRCILYVFTFFAEPL